MSTLRFNQRGRREAPTRMSWRSKTAEPRYKITRSSPAFLATVFYALVLDGDYWRPVERAAGGTPRRFRTKAAAERACRRHYRRAELEPA